MGIRKPIIIFSVAALLVLLALSGCAYQNNGGSNNAGNTNSSAQKANIQNFEYSPSQITIKAGDNVTWANLDSAPHTVTSDSGNELQSSTLGNSQAYSHTFTKAGTYAYHCTVHPMMKGTVIVQ